MAETGFLFMVEEHHKEPRERLADYLRRKFSDGYAAKRLSNAIDCTPRTAENILAGHWPTSRNWQRIAQIFGRDVLDAVFGPDIDYTVARLKREESELEAQLAAKRARRLQAEGVAPSPSEYVGPAEARKLVRDNVKAFAPDQRGRG